MMALPYRLLLAALLLAGLAFALSPWWTLHNIREAAQNVDDKQWRQWVKTDGFARYAETMLGGLYKMKKAADDQKNPVAAMQVYLYGLDSIPDAVGQLTSPKGFGHLLCGDLFSEPTAKPSGNTGCWVLEGSITWLSPVRAKVTFDNPETHWRSSMLLSRVGLFEWQAVGMELPVETIFTRFAKSLGLTPKTGRAAANPNPQS